MSSKCDKIYTEKFLRRQYLELNKLVKRIAKENNTSIAPIYKRLKFYKIKVTNLGFTGMHHTEEWKKKRKIEQMGKNNSFYGKHFSRDWIKEQSKRMKGNKYGYIDGKSNEPYPLEFNNQLKESIRKRDNYICQKCEITEEEHLIVYGEILSIHHIDYNSYNLDETNLITLCRSCNSRVNYNRIYWENYFNNKLGEKCQI